MKLHILTPQPRQGITWIQQSLSAFAHQAWAFSSLLIIFFLVFSFISALPWVGPAIALMGMPLLTLVFMINTERTVSHKAFEWSAIYTPLSAKAPAQKQLLILFIAYAGVMALGLQMCDWVDNDRFAQLLALMSNAQPDAKTKAELEQLLSDPQLSYGLLLRCGLIGLIAVPFWYAPALVYWHQQSAAQSLFSSAIACWRTRKAMMVNMLAWCGGILVLSLIIGTLLPLLGITGMVSWLALPVGLVLTAIFYVSLYFMYKDTFAVAELPENNGDRPHFPPVET